MSDALNRAVLDEYGTLDPLRVRIDTHRHYSEAPDDVEANVLASADLAATHDVLDVGFGTGDFLAHRRPHAGRLTGVDTSAAAVEAATAIDRVEALLGSATALPLRGATFDRVFARHMLYHVGDPLAALAEFHRVTRPGGRVVISVNHRRVVPHAMDLVRAAVLEHVNEPAVPAVIAIDSDNLPGLMERVFGTVRTARFDNHLRFERPEPLIRLAGALTSMCGLPTGSPSYPQVMRTVGEQVHAWFDTHPGPWRDPKGYSVCIGLR